MGRKKADLIQRDHYGRLVAAYRSTEMLRAVAFGEALAYTVRVEQEGLGPWDDVIEEIVSPTGGPYRRGWQVKRQATDLEQETIRDLLRALCTSPPSFRGALGLPMPVRVKGIGNIATLKTLSERAASAGCDVNDLATTKEERQWWRFLGNIVPGPVDRLAILRRFEVHILGEEAILRTHACTNLGFLFKEPQEPIFNDLRLYFAGIHDGMEVDAKLLEEEILKRYPAQRRPSPATIRTARAHYLAEVERSAASRQPLNGLIPEIMLRDVWVPAHQLGASTNDGSGQSLHDWLEAGRGGEQPILVVGEVGRGKTELFVRTAAELAQQAELDELAPLPLVVDARALVAAGLERAARERWPHAAEPLAHLLEAAATRWTILVDGLDEVGAAGADAVAAVRHKLGKRLHALAVATRPVSRWSIPGAYSTQLSAWSSGELEHFLVRWEKHDPAAIAALRSSPHWPTLARLCDGPLTTTLCVLAARDEPEALASRAWVYDRVAARLFQRWAQDRLRRTGSGMAWKDVAPALRRLALEMVRRQRSSIFSSELRDVLRVAARDESEVMEDMMALHLGVLAPRGKDQFDFAFRGLAEFLACQQLLDDGDPAVVRAAFEPWAEEAVRHAVGYAALSDAPRTLRLLEALLKHESDDDIVRTNVNLRPLLITTRSAADIGDVALPIASRLARACARRLCDDTSVWVGDRVADAVLELARAGGPCWAELFQQCLEIACNRCPRPALWYAEQSWSDPHRWVALLHVSDPSVRRVAIEKLERWVDEPGVRDALMWEILDEGGGVGDLTPAVAAGWALRKARRDELFSRDLTALIRGLESQRPLAALASAVALRHPDDPVDPALLVPALKEAGTSFIYPRAVLEELSRSETGRKALDDGLPNWRTMLEWPEPTPLIDWGSPLGESEPPSLRVRARLAHILTRGVHHVDAEQRARLLRGSANADTLFALAPECPELVAELLNEPPTRMLPALSLETMAALGRAAVHHRFLRDKLIERWDIIETLQGPDGLRGTLRRSYPGPVLEPLVSRGDADAIRIYAAWLELFKDTLNIGRRPPIPRDVLEPEGIRRVARAFVDGTLAWATEGRIDQKGQRSMLEIGAAASVLQIFSHVWCDDASVRAQLESWIQGGDSGHFIGALLALEGSPLADHMRPLVAERTRREIHSAQDPIAEFKLQRYTLPVAFAFVHATGMAAELEPELRAVVQERSRATLHAAAVLVSLADKQEAAAISQAAAASPWFDSRLDKIDEQSRRRLVEVAPTAWAEALEEHIRSSPFPLAATLLPLVAVLPHDSKRRVVSTWARAVGGLELPWSQEGSRWGETSRPADRVRQILFDMGLDRDLVPGY